MLPEIQFCRLHQHYPIILSTVILPCSLIFFSFDFPTDRKTCMNHCFKAGFNHSINDMKKAFYQYFSALAISHHGTKAIKEYMTVQRTRERIMSIG